MEKKLQGLHDKFKTEKMCGKMIDDSASATFLVLMCASTNLYVSCQTPSFTAEFQYSQHISHSRKS